MVVVGKNIERETFQRWQDTGIKTEVSSKGGRIGEQERAEITEEELETKSPLGIRFQYIGKVSEQLSSYSTAQVRSGPIMMEYFPSC